MGWFNSEYFSAMSLAAYAKLKLLKALLNAKKTCYKIAAFRDERNRVKKATALTDSVCVFFHDKRLVNSFSHTRSRTTEPPRQTRVMRSFIATPWISEEFCRSWSPIQLHCWDSVCWPGNGTWWRALWRLKRLGPTLLRTSCSEFHWPVWQAAASCRWSHRATEKEAAKDQNSDLSSSLQPVWSSDCSGKSQGCGCTLTTGNRRDARVPALPPSFARCWRSGVDFMAPWSGVLTSGVDLVTMRIKVKLKSSATITQRRYSECHLFYTNTNVEYYWQDYFFNARQPSFDNSA